MVAMAVSAEEPWMSMRWMQGRADVPSLLSAWTEVMVEGAWVDQARASVGSAAVEQAAVGSSDAA